MTNSKNISAFFTELLGTFFIVVVTSWSFMAKDLKVINYMGLGLANGLVLAACIWAGVSVSGAHFNPVVTIVKLGIRQFPFSKAIMYVSA